MIRKVVLCGAVLMVGGVEAKAEPLADPNSIWTFQAENDALNQTDRYYTSGLRLGWTSPTDALPGFLANLGHKVWGDGRQRIAFDISQIIFTPFSTQRNPPDRFDRPYSAVLMGNFSLIQDTDTTRSVLGLSVGLIGPGAGGEEIQNGWHNLTGDTTTKGWGYQIHNEPVIQLLSERTWRLPLTGFATPVGAFDIDALPELTAAVGNWRDYVQTGVQFRLGQGLDSDFGAPRIRPGLSGADAYTATRPFAWYVFAGVDGQAVGYDATLDGNLFRSSRHVSRQPFLAEAQGGLAIMAYGLRIAFTHAVQTQAFHNQHGGLFMFDSLAISAKF